MPAGQPETGDGGGQLECSVCSPLLEPGLSLVLAGKTALLIPGRGVPQMLNICRANQPQSAFVQGMLVRSR